MAKRPAPPKAGLTRRQASRAQREARLQRFIWVGTGAIATIVLGLLIFAVVNELYLKPARAVATVGDEKITVAGFQERVKFDYYRLTGGAPIEQTGLDPTFFAQQVLDTMVDEIVIENRAAEMGIEVSDEEVQEQLQLAFGYDAGQPEPTPTAFPTSRTPTGEPTVTPTFVYTLTPSPTPTLEPGVTPSPTATPSPTPSGTLTPTPTRTPAPTPEPMTEEEFQTSYSDYIQGMSEATEIPEQRVAEMWNEAFRISLLRGKLIDALGFETDETKTLVHAAHILVETEEEARAALERIRAGEDFAVVAAEVSTDTTNAYKGGDLGWFGRGQMVEPFEEAAFSLEPGEVSEPVETSFGWHIIKVFDRTEVPTTFSEREQQRQQAFRDKVDEWRDEVGVELSDIWPQYVPELPTAAF